MALNNVHTADAQATRRYWKVIHDPSGSFANRYFRGLDLRHGGGFPVGTISEHVRTGEQKQVGPTRSQTIKPARKAQKEN